MDKNYTFIEKINKMIILLSCIGALGASAGLIFDYFSKTRTIFEVLLVCFVTAGAAFTSSIIYKKNKESKYIRILCMNSFIFYYGFLYITYPSFLPFIFVFPILLLETLYASKKGLIFSIIEVILINIIGTAIKINGKVITAEITSSLIMQFGCIIAFLVIIIIIVHYYAESTTQVAESMKKINTANEVQKNILSDILNLIEMSNKNSHSVYDIVVKTSDSSFTITTNIDKITEQLSQASNGIEKQSILIHNIQDKISNTVVLSDEMKKLFIEIQTGITSSFTSSNELNVKNNRVNKSYATLYDGMIKLKEKTSAIYSITEVIASISEKTNLLALNAAIEATHAGEQGKGFAIVASEIKKLSESTKIATDTISSMIQDIIAEMNANVFSVSKLRDLNNEQTNLISNTDIALKNINTSVETVTEKINLIGKEIQSISIASQEIHVTATTISSATNAITLQAEETYIMAKEHIQDSRVAKKLVNELIDTSHNMDKYLQ